jgi:uncharacterized protein YbjT (DUF2867 family)
MNALLVGATGATGKDLLVILLKDDSIQQVDVFVRRNLDVRHEKLRIHIINFDRPEEWNHLVKGDVLFSCLGTTLKAAGSKQAQWKVDYDYQYSFAKAAKENNVPCYVLVSSASASPDSRLYYLKMKGQLEVAVKKLNFVSLHIFNPPVLIRKNSDRSAEVAGWKLIKFLNKLGLFRSQQPLETGILAQAMLNVAKRNSSGITQYKNQDIRQLA